MRGIYIAAAVTALLLLLLPFALSNPFYQDIIITVFLFAGLGMAWNIIGGFAGQFSLGHAGFFGIGAYTSTLLYLNCGLSPWLGMILGGLLAALVSLLVFYPCFRLRGIFFAMSTMAFAQVLNILAVYWTGLTQGSIGLLIPFTPGFKNFIFQDKAAFAVVALVYMAITLIVSHLVKRSKLGFYLVALRENEDAAQALGVNTSRCKLQAMMISAFLTAMGGTFYAQYLQFIDPDSLFPAFLSIRFALLAIIGGVGTVIGPMLGSFILTPLDVFLRGWLGGSYAGLGFFFYGCILVSVVLVRPQGLLKLLQERTGRFFLLQHETELPESEPSPPIRIAAAEVQNGPGDDTVLEVKGLGKNFGGIAAIKDVDFSVRRGEILGLIGPNGAGKTTFFNLITGFIPSDRGRVYLNGGEIGGLSANVICKRGIGRTFQLVKPFLNISVVENVTVGAYCRCASLSQAERKAREILRFVGLGRYSDYLSSNLTLSNRKRLELARALATSPELLLLDETMAGLNPKEIDDMIVLLRNISGTGVTLVIIEHVMRAVMALSDRVVVLNHGEKISEGSPLEISRDEKVIQAYLGGSYLHVTPARD